MKIIDFLAFIYCKQALFKETKEALIKENERYKKMNINEDLIKKNDDEIEQINFENKAMNYIASYFEEMRRTINCDYIDFTQKEFFSRVEEMFYEITVKGKGKELLVRDTVN